MTRLPIDISDDIIIQYGQIIDDVSYGRCYIFAFLVAISTLTNIRLTMDQIKAFIKFAKDKGKNPEYGGSPDGGRKIAEEFWNSIHPDRPMESKKVLLFSSEFWGAISKGRPVVVSIRVGQKWREDREDGKLDYSSYPTMEKEKKIGHSITIQKKGPKFYFADSRRDNKIYEIPGRERMQKVQGLFKGRNAFIVREKTPGK